MALDLTLIAISNKASFIVDKAQKSLNYATDLDKVQNINELRRHLKMVQGNPKEKEFEISLIELIKDSEFVISLYPGNKYESYIFTSKTRGYDTLKYLLQHYLLEHNNPKGNHNKNIFHGGVDIDFAKQHSRFEYLDSEKTALVCELLSSIEFDDLLKYYDYEKMTNIVYKLTRPENLGSLKLEFQELKQFYSCAKNIDAFILIKVS